MGWLAAARRVEHHKRVAVGRMRSRNGAHHRRGWKAASRMDMVARSGLVVARRAGFVKRDIVGMRAPHIDPAAGVSAQAKIGAGVWVRANAQIRGYAVIGDRSSIEAGAVIDARVRVGANARIGEGALLVEGVTLADGVYVGARACFTNELFPRAINLDGTAREARDQEVIPCVVEYGASIGSGAVVRCGVTIGRFALVAAGAVVTRDVAPHSLVTGSPARHVGYVCRCGYTLERVHVEDGTLLGYCARCDRVRDITP
jgi:UDP-2-acetamido-3-amino-2,3-dideoxy-glucuronate N-acetyltransferase